MTSEGTFSVLKLSYNLPGKGRQREIKHNFGYVQQTSVDELKQLECYGEVDRERISMLLKIARDKNKEHKLRHLVTYTIKCKSGISSVEKLLSFDKPFYMRVFSRIKPELRKFEALLSLSRSPLQRSIITLDPKTFKVGMGSEHLHASIKDVPALSKLNFVQKRTVVSVSRACFTDPESPGISLIQGPPGTGKSSTITGLLCQMLYSRMKNNAKETFPRALVVAPSNAAVDELAKKLISVRKHLPEQVSKFRLVRLGVHKAIHKDVKRYSLDEIIDRKVVDEANEIKSVASLQRDIDVKQKSANKLFQDKSDAEEAGNQDLADKLDRDWKQLMNQIKKLKAEIKKPLGPKERRELRRKAEDSTLAEADIILSTMSSCVVREMDRFFVQGELKYFFYSKSMCINFYLSIIPGVKRIHTAEAERPISVCIMEEASQCVEPEALIPLRLGFSKLVMVGDHEQLQATVISNKARDLQYQQSLFGRLISHLTTGASDHGHSAGHTPPLVSRCPVFRLKTQYRMHPDIALWPNR